MRCPGAYFRGVQAPEMICPEAPSVAVKGQFAADFQYGGAPAQVVCRPLQNRECRTLGGGLKWARLIWQSRPSRTTSAAPARATCGCSCPAANTGVNLGA